MWGPIDWTRMAELCEYPHCQYDENHLIQLYVKPVSSFISRYFPHFSFHFLGFRQSTKTLPEFTGVALLPFGFIEEWID